MGIFKDNGVVYKPVSDVDVGPHSDDVYISPKVKGTNFFFQLSAIVDNYYFSINFFVKLIDWICMI